ncbi:hypothetical protein [Erwinia sorbitola]|uniref:Uncharacterized protein n=1 Tax=Erwinia sorbitola TaxID=2681984 RepID=A0A6I6EMM7_9GAMM|nr:hypothetical protein [Erwinia sorbitola]QGU89818.1 hypothetical protein GN242_21430 [Erwinia sorbitola]
MLKIKTGILMLSAVVFSGSAFADINSNEKKLRQSVQQCISNIHADSKITSPNLPKVTKIIYDVHGGVQKYCGSIANKTRKLITAEYDQVEAWQAEYRELSKEYLAIPISDRNKPYAKNIVRKLIILLAPEKLGSTGADSKLNIYRAILKEVDNLDALLIAIDGN